MGFTRATNNDCCNKKQGVLKQLLVSYLHSQEIFLERRSAWWYIARLHRIRRESGPEDVVQGGLLNVDQPL